MKKTKRWFFICCINIKNLKSDEIIEKLFVKTSKSDEIISFTFPILDNILK